MHLGLFLVYESKVDNSELLPTIPITGTPLHCTSRTENESLP